MGAIKTLAVSYKCLMQSLNYTARSSHTGEQPQNQLNLTLVKQGHIKDCFPALSRSFKHLPFIELTLQDALQKNI